MCSTVDHYWPCLQTTWAPQFWHQNGWHGRLLKPWRGDNLWVNFLYQAKVWKNLFEDMECMGRWLLSVKAIEVAFYKETVVYSSRKSDFFILWNSCSCPKISISKLRISTDNTPAPTLIRHFFRHKRSHRAGRGGAGEGTAWTRHNPAQTMLDI